MTLLQVLLGLGLLALLGAAALLWSLAAVVWLAGVGDRARTPGGTGDRPK